MTFQVQHFSVLISLIFGVRFGFECMVFIGIEIGFGLMEIPTLVGALESLDSKFGVLRVVAPDLGMDFSMFSFFPSSVLTFGPPLFDPPEKPEPGRWQGTLGD